MSPATVTLASALQVRGEALSEEEIWSLLSLAAERLLEDLCEGSSDYVVSPWSTLLSMTGRLTFQGNISHIEAAPFKPPELLQQQNNKEQPDASQMHVYSLGMTLYWSAGFHVPPHQPLQLQEPLCSVLLAMCEDQPCTRLPLQSVLEASRAHREGAAARPASANLHVRRLVGSVLGTISEVERRVVEESSPVQQDRSSLLRNRLHPMSCESPTAQALQCLHPCGVSERRTETQSFLEPHPSTSGHSQCHLSVNRPEFILLAGQDPVTLHLPGSIVTKKGKSCLTLRDLSVVLLSGQCLEVKCDITSTVGAVFNAIMSFANLKELTYFGLAYMKDKEFFFLDNETRLCKIAPEGWNEQPQKISLRAFTLFLRIKFFVNHYGLLQQSETRHQFYLQLRKDILEEKLYCNDETLLLLGVLALQAEFGSYPEEVETKAYFCVEDYIPASLIEKMTALRVQVQVSGMHRLSPALWGEDAELEFLRVVQQLPEYGVLVHQVLPEKTRLEREMALGICAKGIIIYEVKNNSRIATLRFQWREIGKISTYRKKFTITSSITGKKHSFFTDSAKTCKYLLGLCSAQHGFNAQMNIPRVATDYDKCVQRANLSPAHLAQSKPHTWIQRLSCSENMLLASRLQGPVGGPLCTSLDSFTVDTSRDMGPLETGGSSRTSQEQLESICLVQKPTNCDPLSGMPVQSVCTGSRIERRSFTAEPDQEIVHVTLNRDPHHGFGFVINEGEDVGKVDPGIFISSIIPGGPAEKAKKIKPGGKIIALNHISLEGFTFDMAVRMIQNSPTNIELVISQSKDSLSNGHQSSFVSHTQDQERNAEELEMAGTQSLLSRWRPQLCAFPLKGAGSSCSPSLSESIASGIYFVELVKEDGTLGFSVTGGINTRVLYGGIYVKSIVPGGPAAKEGQILRGDKLLQVNGMSLCGLTHRQAVECLKGSGQEEIEDIAKQKILSGLKFEVKLKKNASGLGFSFMQMDRESCSHLRKDLVRIRRLFPGQPAEESGAIAAGDIILAVNGKPTEGLVFQEVLHLLRGGSQEVTLLLCRPPPGVLPEMDQGWQTPLSDKEFTRATCTDSEQSPSLDQEDSQRDSASPDTREGLDLRPGSFPQATREAQWDQDIRRPRATSLRCPGYSHPHLCRLYQEADTAARATSLEQGVRQNCYSVCDIRRLESPELDKHDEEGDMCHPPEVPFHPVEDEAYLPINCTSEDRLSCGKCLEADSGTIPLPQVCSWGALSESLPLEGSHDSESEWGDLEETMDPDDSALRS